MSDSIEMLHHAGIKVWVPNSNTQNSSINIGSECTLLTDNISIICISGSDTVLIVSQMYKLILLFVIILRIAYYVLIFHRGRQYAFVLPIIELLSVFLVVVLCCAIILYYF